MKSSRGYIAVGLWVLSAALMVYGADEFNRNRGVCGFAWGIWVAIVAIGFTTWVLSERRDHMRERTIEHIAEVVAALQDSGDGPRRIR